MIIGSMHNSLTSYGKRHKLYYRPGQIDRRRPTRGWVGARAATGRGSHPAHRSDVTETQSISARSWVVPAVSRSVATFAPERCAQPQVGWQRGGERADAQAAPAVDLDVSPGQHRVGTPVGEYQRIISTPERQVGRRVLRFVEGGWAQADDERLTGPEFGLGPIAEPHDRRAGGLGFAHEQHLHCDVFHVVAQDADLVTDPTRPAVQKITANLLVSTVQLGLASSGWAAFLMNAVWLGSVVALWMTGRMTT